MKEVARTALLAAAVALSMGALGYAVGSLVHRSAPARETTGEVREPSPGEPGEHFHSPRVDGETLPPVALPVAEFKDRAGFDRYVAALVAAGLAEDLAQCLAMALLAERDFSSAFEIARLDAELLPLWASGAAQHDPRAAFPLLSALPRKEAAIALSPFFSALGRNDPVLGLELIEQAPAEKFPVHYARFFRGVGALGTRGGGSPRADSRHAQKTAHGSLRRAPGVAGL